MAFQRSSVGIDIGSHAIKVVQLKVTEKGAFIQNALYFDHANLAARGVDPEDRAAVADLLSSQMAEAGIPLKGVVLSISGSDSILRYTAVPPVPAWRLKVIMDYEVKEVAEKVGEPLASDYRLMPLPRDDGEQSVLVGLSKEEGLEALLAVLGSAGISIDKAVPAPVALFTAHDAFGVKCDPESPDDDLVVFVDIGRHNLSTVLVLNDHIVFARSVSFGGETFTTAIANDLGVDSEKAEAIKLKHGSVELADATNKTSETMVNSLRGAAAQLQNLIQSSLRFCRTQVGVKVPEPSRMYLVGGGARLKGLAGYLQKAFHKPVEMFHPTGVVATGKLEGDAAANFGSFPGDFSVPIGLAVAGVRDSAFSLNILPTSYVERRHFRDRTVFLYAAAVFLVVNLICGVFNAYRLNSKADERKELLVATRSALEQQNADMESNSEENLRTRQRVNRILREVEVTGFQAFVLDYLRANMRPEIMLKRVNLEPKLDELEADFDYSIVLEGVADDANQQGVAFLEALQQQLRSENRIAGAEFNKMEPAGTTYEFVLVVTPSFQRY